MRIVLLQAAAVDESLALCDLAGILRAGGHTLRLVLTRHERDWLQTVRAFRPDAALVQAAFMAEAWLRQTVAALPAGLPVILGGTAATFEQDLLRRVPATAALQGELDDVAPPVFAQLERGGDLADLPGVVVLRDGALRKTPWPDHAPALEPRPLPDRDLYFDPYPFMGRFPWKRFATGRGCVHSCGFCYLPGLRESYGGLSANVRRKSVRRVIDEALAVRARWPLRRVHFADDLFAPSRAWLEEFATSWPVEVGVPFTCNTSPETVTEANAELLAQAGARVVGIGLETGVEANRIDRLGRPTRDEAIRRAAERLKRRGIQLLTFNMLANPGERFDEALQTLRLNQELGTDFPRVNLAFPTEGSILQAQIRELGREPPPPGAFARGDWRAWCAEGDPEPFENLQRMFRLTVRHAVPPPVVAALSRLPRPLFGPLALYNAWVEMRWSGVSPLAAARYARHAGRPDQRVTYHESLP